MGNGKPLLFFALLLSGLIINCTQEPLFFDIANEIPPIEPIIGGAPSRIVEMGGDLYVANGSVWKYDGNWHKMAQQPPGRIKAVASTAPPGDTLFALNWSGELYKWDGTANWIPVDGVPSATERIFGAGNYLFAGAPNTAGNPDGYSILSMYYTGNTLSLLQSGTGLLMGAVSDGTDIFLATRGQGVLKVAVPVSAPGTTIAGSEGSIMGIIDHNGTIFAVTDRWLLYYNGSVFQTSSSHSAEFSGAMASWTWTDDTNTTYWLLLLGLLRSSGSYGYGYRELQLDNTGTPLYGLRIPGESSPSSVILDYQYTNAIGQHAVTALHVMPSTFSRKADGEGRPIIFASTQKDGLWSYRSRGGQPQWNGEDNSPD